MDMNCFGCRIIILIKIKLLRTKEEIVKEIKFTIEEIRELKHILRIEINMVKYELEEIDEDSIVNKIRLKHLNNIMDKLKSH